MATAAPANAGTPVSPFAIFRNRSFRLMWTGQLVSTMGSALTSLAASIYVFNITGSAASVGLMLMASAAPSLLVGLVAGVFVDRMDRRRIMLAANLIRAILVFSIPFLVPLNIAWLYVIVALSSAVGQFFDPAHESILPEVASEEELAAANSLMAISSFGSTAIGFAASGLLAASGDIKWAFYFDALSFLFSAACIWLIPVKPLVVEGSASVRAVLRNLQTGLSFLTGSPILRSLLVATIPVLIGFGLSNSLLLPFAQRALNATTFQYGIQEAMTSIGFVVGSLLMAGMFDRMREGPWIAVSFIAWAVTGILYSFSQNIPVAILILTVSGFVNAPSAIGRRLVIQRNTPREMRGRVNSAFFVTRDVLFLIGMALAGLADVVDVRVMYLISALLALAGGILVLVMPGLRQDAAEWKRALGLLRGAATAPGAGAGRAAVPADFDALAGHMPALSALNAQERASLISGSRVVQAPAGAAIVRHGETSDAAYFILSGKTVAGIAEPDGSYRSLSTMLAGDFFGEIAALTGVARTADVVAVDASTLLQTPAPVIRGLMANPAFSDVILSKMHERLARTNLTDLPRFAGLDQQALQQLRSEAAAGEQ
jgi:MFS transporter, DHA3 family, macrolide efflux protein